VHVEQSAAAGALVQVVDVLGDEQELARPQGVEACQRQMRGIGPDRRLEEPAATQVVEGLHERGIAGEGLGRRHILDAMTLPEPVRPAEGGEPRFARDVGAGEHDDPPAGFLMHGPWPWRRCVWRMAPRAGLEPATRRLTAACSTD
jgi:hypothetical protein